MARIRFIIDPVNSRIGTRWPYEEERIRALTSDYQIHLVRGRLHAYHLAKEAAESNAELIVIVGGDGALSEVVNALYPQNEKSPRVTLYRPLQAGDFVKSYEFREDFLDFLKDFLEGKATEDSIDLGRITYTGEYGQPLRHTFVNYAAFGYGSLVLNRLPQGASPFKLLRLIFRTLPFYRIPAMRCQHDNDAADSEFLLTGFINNIPYAGRGLKVAPEAIVNDGKFALTKAKKAGLFRYLWAALQAYFGRKSKADFIESDQCKHLKIESTMVGRKVRIDFDGESRGFLPAEIQIRENALKILR